MAGALIGEAFISASIQVLCDRITSREFIDFFRQKKLNEPLLMKLKMTLLTLYAVLNDAEEKQISNPAVREWLDELKHAVFDAEDLVEEINTEALRSKVEGEDQTDNLTKKVWNFLSTSRNNFYQSMNVKIEELLQRLESFVQQKSDLGLTEVVGRKVSQRTPTTSLVHEPCVYGRDKNKENLLEVLLSDDASSNNVSVITIVGMGGIGKTTLARLLYNDDKVKEHFTMAAWSCVSEDYDAVRVTKTLLESVTSRPCHIADLNLLQVQLREQVRGKKFLFVLDDLWNEKYVDWKCLQTPFTSGERGSKIIVTTRNKNVASIMQNVPIQYLKPLSHEDCWLILAKHAFGNEIHSAHPNLAEIGKQIAQKCNGLPLAAETLGGLLRSKIDPEEWNGVLNSSIWELPRDKSDIIPALALSYHYLPAQLKRCFAYCSIFPKDYEFKKDDIVQLWMVEGLIPPIDNGNRMEEVAKEYFDELLSRSLFQKLTSTYLGVRFTMHDLINDLAMFVSKGFCFRLEEKESKVLPERVRHLSYIRGEFDVAPKFEPLYGMKSLRTFLPMSFKRMHGSEKCYISNRVLHDLLPALRSLRVLCLSRYKNFSEIPNSIGNLIHLHYLDLSYTAIKKLPDVMCTLYNLQTLLLSECYSLRELPADMRKLINLQHLDIYETGIQEMPVQMGSLKRLRTLTAFAVGKSTGSGIGELRAFPHLGGKLSILNLQNVVNATDALQANLKDKKDLKELELSWSIKDADDSQKERDVADKLQPCANLEKLSIRYYGGTSFPKWLTESSLCRVQVMRLSDCTYCWLLPPVGSLPSLKELYIERMKCVRTVGAEFYGGNGASSSSVIKPFQSLEKLEFLEMPEWEEWLPNPSGSGGQCPDFPRLVELTLRNCPKLRGSLPMHLPCLEALHVIECGLLHDESYSSTNTVTTNMELVLNTPLLHLHINDGCPGLLSLLETKFLSNSTHSLGSLTLRNCPSLSMFPSDGLPTTLTSLQIVNCQKLEFLPQIPKLKSLQVLVIDGSCDSLRSFPMGIFPKLSILEIRNCRNLESLSISIEEGVDKEKNLRRLSWLEIKNCLNFVSFPHPGGGWPAPNLTRLKVRKCENLKSLPESLHTLTTLRDLCIGNLPNLVPFAQGDLPPNLLTFRIQNCDHVLETLLEHQLLPTTLHTLEVSNLSSLKSLDGKGLRHLTSLQQLRISSCPSLELLPEEGMPTSLSFLEIEKCSALEKRYNNKTGQEWAKISHIPCIEIGEQVLIL